MTEHLVLIGFKAVGKTTVGRALAPRLHRAFTDLDELILQRHAQSCDHEKTCREVVQAHGEDFFRTLETEVLQETLKQEKPMVLAVGGGAALSQTNQELLKGQRLVHLGAPQGILRERYLKTGAPEALFSSLWEQRLPTYERLASLTVQNDGPLEETVEKLLQQLA